MILQEVEEVQPPQKKAIMIKPKENDGHNSKSEMTKPVVVMIEII